MKIEIDLNEIMESEYGDKESLSESIHRQIVEQLTSTLKDGIDRKINAEIALLIQGQIKAIVETQMPALVDELMNTEYHEVSQWGDIRKEKTTVRKELVKAIQAEMQYKPGNGGYGSDKNTFTRAVNAAVEEHVKGFKKAYDAQMVELFQKEAFTYAVNKMAEKLGLSVQNK